MGKTKQTARQKYNSAKNEEVLSFKKEREVEDLNKEFEGLCLDKKQNSSISELGKELQEMKLVPRKKRIKP